jgi:hypothetical protein
VREGELALGNAVIRATWTFEEGELRPRQVVDLVGGATLDLAGEPFQILFSDGSRIAASRLEAGPPETGSFGTGPGPRASDGCRGVEIVVPFTDPAGRLAASWRAELRDGSSYVRQSVTITAGDAPLAIREVGLFGFDAPGARRVGSVRGSVVVAGNLYLAVEHPMAETDAGHRLKRVGTWDPSGVTWPECSRIAWDVTAIVREAGPLEARFQYTQGGHRLEIYRAWIEEEGREVAADEHFGATGDSDVDNRYRFDLPSHLEGARYTLAIDARADGGTDSAGWAAIGHAAGPPRARGSIVTDTGLRPGQAMSLGSVVGVVPEGQLRRGFLYYLERERAHPYRPLLHYNSWYDIGYFSKYDEAACLDVVRSYGEELVEKRGAILDSFLFDDGWDDTRSLWDFHDGFPDGFAKVRELVESYGAGLGVWLSPWGGYGEPKKERLAAGKEAGYETNAGGFALSAPKYFARFREICLEMVERYGANQFKFDGVSRASGSDFEAAIALIDTLREARPDLYINQTTGTWPSPFWLLKADSIWRGGYDHEFMGVGSERQRWITYRDAMTYRNVVRGGPLFPLSSLMLHGVIYAKRARGLDTDPEGDFRAEVRSAFGCGTQHQELYATPSLLMEADWDDLAAAAKWARERADTLRDVHWVGGDPGKLEPYGWAAWSPGRGTLVLRNPKSGKRAMSSDVAEALELPPGEPGEWRLESPWEDQRVREVVLRAGKPKKLNLRPFEVLTFDARPDGER